MRIIYTCGDALLHDDFAPTSVFLPERPTGREPIIGAAVGATIAISLRRLEWQWRQLRKPLLGYCYGIRGNYRALVRYRCRLWRWWYQSLSHRSQKSNVHRLTHLLTGVFPLPKVRVTEIEVWMNIAPGDMLGRAGCGYAARQIS